MGRRTGVDADAYRTRPPRTRGVEELSIDLTLRSDGSVELKYTASTSVNEEAALRIDYTLAGNSSRMTAKGTVQVRNVCDVTFDAAVSVRTTSEKPLTAPPAGATIITLPPVMTDRGIKEKQQKREGALGSGSALSFLLLRLIRCRGPCSPCPPPPS